MSNDIDLTSKLVHVKLLRTAEEVSMARTRAWLNATALGLTVVMAACHSPTKPAVTPAAAPPAASTVPRPPAPPPPPPRSAASPAPVRSPSEEELFNRKSLEALNAEQ